MTDKRKKRNVFPCPICGGETVYVTCYPKKKGLYYRYRKCKKCGKVVRTKEIPG